MAVRTTSKTRWHTCSEGSRGRAPEEDLERVLHDVVGPQVLVGAEDVAGGYAEGGQDPQRDQGQQHDGRAAAVPAEHPFWQGYADVQPLPPVRMPVLFIVLPGHWVCRPAPRRM